MKNPLKNPLKNRPKNPMKSPMKHAVHNGLTNPVKARRLFRSAAIVFMSFVLMIIAHRTGLRASQGNAVKANAVKIVPNGRPIGGNPGEKGATYYALEGKTTRFTTRFLDGTTAVGERSADGNIQTRLEDLAGNEINRFNVGHGVLMYLRPSADPVQAVPDPSVHTTLDWSTRQSHRLHQDGVISSAGLVWRDGLMRHASATARDEERSTVREVETQWANGLSARTVRVRATQGQKFDGHPVQGDILVTKLIRDGVAVGLTNYFTFERIYAWTMPGVTEGLINNDHLKTRYAGWPFTPDMVWMNLQAIGLYHWKTMINEKGFVARCQPPKTNPLVQFFIPTVSADEPGCDGLHWLDGTVLRFCCDRHDACYAKFGCDYHTWWMWWSSWRCDWCNMGTVQCFASGAASGGPYQDSPF